MVTLDRKTVSIPRACELVGVSRRTIYNWIAGGKIEYVRTAGGSVRIFADTLWREPEQANQAHEGKSDETWSEGLRRGA
jgi:excisionase family DNA binding protein